MSASYAWFAMIASIGLYAVFLVVQTLRHSDFFTHSADDAEDGAEFHHEGLEVRSGLYHTTFLVLCMLPIVLLSKKLAVLVDHGLSTLGAPT